MSSNREEPEQSDEAVEALRAMFQSLEASDEKLREDKKQNFNINAKRYDLMATSANTFLSGTASSMRFGRNTVGAAIGNVVAAPFAFLGGIANVFIYGDRSWPEEAFQGTRFVYNVVKYGVGSLLSFVPAIISGVIDSITCKVIKERGNDMAQGMWKLLKIGDKAGESYSRDDKVKENAEICEHQVDQFVKAIVEKYEQSKSLRQSVSSRELIKKLKNPTLSAFNKTSLVSAYMNNPEHVGHRLYNVIGDHLAKLGRDEPALERTNRMGS